jgi:glycerate kinase
MKILSVLDSFKGTLSSKKIAELVTEHFIATGIQVTALPISDGGEGLIDSITSHVSCNLYTIDTIDGIGNSIKAIYAICDNIAYLEVSSAVGVNLLKQSELNPNITTSYGVGLIIKDAIKKSVKKIVIGIGGSSTNDGGSGLLQALGVKFYYNNDLITEYMCGSLLSLVTEIDTTELIKLVSDIDFTLATDVTNPLLGKNGCANVYASQKGASKNDLFSLENGMKHFAAIIEEKVNFDYSSYEGAGAAGGIGFGCLALLNGTITPGIDLNIIMLELEKYIIEADIVIVGEGSLDEQTLFGKAPQGIAKLAKKHKKRVIGLFGKTDLNIKSEFIDDYYSIVPKIATVEESINNPIKYFKLLLNEIKL